MQPCKTDPDRKPSDLGLILERFDYARVGEHLAVVQILVGLTADLEACEDAELLIRDGRGARLRFPAQSGRAERRLLAGGGSELLWRVLFTVPAAFVGRPGVLFELGVGALDPLMLPFPVARAVQTPGLKLTSVEALDADAPRLGTGQLRQAVALATAVAVTATSTPALALAGGLSSANQVHATAHRTAGVARSASERLSRHSAAQTGGSRATGHTTVGTPGAARSRSTAPPHQRGSASSAAKVGPAPRKHPSSTGASVATSGSARPTSAPAASPSSVPTARPSAPATSPTCAGPLAVVASRSPAATAANAGGACRSRTPVRSSAVDGLGPSRSSTRASASAPAHAVTNGRPTPSSSGQTTLGSPGAAAVGSGPAAPTGPVAPTPTVAVPEPVLTPQPGTLAPVSAASSPAAARVKPEPASHLQAPATLPASISGGAALKPSGVLESRPPVKLPGTSTATAAPTLVPSPPGFLGPQSWTGTVSNDPALSGALGNLSNLLTNGDSPPRFLIPIYMEAGRRYDVPWEVLAAINAVESDYGRNLNTSSAGAIGWMQFEPSTWQRYGLAVDGHSVPNPYDPRDAIFSAARYLAAAGAARDIWGAVYAYNHASWYVDMVLSRARAIAEGVRPQHQTVKHGVVSVFFATFARRHRSIRYKGGVLSHYDRLIATANMVSAANFPYVWGGGHEQPAQFGPFDCSGSVSYVLQQAGYKVPTTVSGDVSSWKFPTGPGKVTIFFNSTHTFMRIGNRYFGTSGFARPSGGAGWFDTNQLPVGYLAQFNEVHVPQLGGNTFAPHAQRHHHRRHGPRSKPASR